MLSRRCHLPIIEYPNHPADGDEIPSILRATGHVLAYGEERSLRDGVLFDEVDVVIQILLAGFESVVAFTEARHGACGN